MISYINWKMIIPLVITVILLLSGLIFYKKSSEKNQSLIKLINVDNNIPESYYQPKFTKKEEKKPKKSIQSMQKKEKKQDTVPKAKNKKKFNFAREKEISSVELKRRDILAQLNKINFNNKNVLITKKEYELPKEYAPKNTTIKNPHLYEKDFGLLKREASKRVDLTRVIGVDNMISALLITAVNSHLAGKVLALVEDDVYAAQGRNILIPKGSQIVGWYLPLKKIGDERLPITWKIIRTPAGVNINISADSADVMGRSGAMGELDNRFLDRYGSSLFFSTVTNTASYIALAATSANKDGVETAEAQAKRDLIADYKDDLTSIIDQMLQEHLKIKPSINLEAGERILISPKADIWFPQAENNNVNLSLVQEIQSKKEEN
jgi:type IV secretory pathway VirB10-like protein